MNWHRIIHSWITHYAIIYIITLIVAIIIGPLFVYNSDILYWLASTIAQGFGALIAIVWAIGLYQKKGIRERYDSLIKSANTNLNALSEAKESSNIREMKNVWYNLLRDTQNEKKENESKFYSQFGATLQSFALLIGSSLLIIIFNPIIKEGNANYPQIASITMIWMGLILVIHSFYCLQLLINRIAGYWEQI